MHVTVASDKDNLDGTTVVCKSSLSAAGTGEGEPPSVLDVMLTAEHMDKAAHSEDEETVSTCWGEKSKAANSKNAERLYEAKMAVSNSG